MYEERMIFGMKLGKRIVSLLVSTAIAITSLIPINLMAFAADPNYQYYKCRHGNIRPLCRLSDSLYKEIEV